MQTFPMPDLNEKGRRPLNFNLSSYMITPTHLGLKSMTPSLTNFMLSLLAGGLIVVVPATVALIVFAKTDAVKRS
jgi:photosystem II PsbX protein